VFNALLLTLFAVVVATGRWQNGLFGIVIVANSGIGIVQEVRAKRTLDRLAILNIAKSRVVRRGAVLDIDLADLVADDLVELRAGDQVPADGTITEAAGLEIDESLLSGESEPVAKHVGHRARSGSIVVAGRGRFQATAVGAEAYAAKLATEAKKPTLVHSELVTGTNRLLRWISLVMLIVAPFLLWSQFRSADNAGWQDAVTGVVAAMVGMVPEGLVLLTSLAFMLGTVSLARKQTLVQELPAVEGLAPTKRHLQSPLRKLQSTRIGHVLTTSPSPQHANGPQSGPTATAAGSSAPQRWSSRTQPTTYSIRPGPPLTTSLQRVAGCSCSPNPTTGCATNTMTASQRARACSYLDRLSRWRWSCSLNESEMMRSKHCDSSPNRESR